MPLTRPTVASSPLTSGALEAVTPPAPTSEAVAAGGSVTGWTFGAFTDPDSRIDSYSATLTAVVGSGSLSGSGLGPYSLTGTADGDAYTVELDALDSGGAVLATATHSVAIASGLTTYALNFDGVDAYALGYAAGNLPAQLQIDLPTESVTFAMIIRSDSAASSQGGSFGVSASANCDYHIRGLASGQYSFNVSGTGTSGATPSLNVWRDATVGQAYFLILGQWDHSTGLASIATPTETVSKALTPTSPTFSGAAYGLGNRYAWYTTLYYFDGGVQQAAMWSTAQLGNIAELWNGGEFIDWSTLANPPDLAHYLIGSDDDATTTNGIQDRTGNGHHLTMFNSAPEGIAALPSSRW